MASTIRNSADMKEYLRSTNLLPRKEKRSLNTPGQGFRAIKKPSHLQIWGNKFQAWTKDNGSPALMLLGMAVVAFILLFGIAAFIG